MDAITAAYAAGGVAVAAGIATGAAVRVVPGVGQGARGAGGGEVRAYYSEFDPQAAAWLRELMADGLITPGVVDERDIRDVAADDVRGFDRVHFFAGVGGWELALGLAGWGDAPVWTGSCPCQPFSSAGKREAQEDERDLWPVFYRLIAECRPAVVFGEQVASADVVGTESEAAFVAAVQAGDFAKANRLAERIAAKNRGRDVAELDPRWVDRLQADLEAEGYAVWFDVLGAHSVGADHIRQRLYWVADAERTGVRGGGRGAAEGAAVRVQGTDGEWQRVRADSGPVGGAGSGRLAESEGQCGSDGERVAYAGGTLVGPISRTSGRTGSGNYTSRVGGRGINRGEGGLGCRVAGANGGGRGADGELRGLPQVHGRGADERVPAPGASPRGGLGDPDPAGPQGRGVRDGRRANERAAGAAGGQPAAPWSDSVLIPCRDGKWRRVPAAQPGVQPVADGLPAILDDERGACGDRFPLAGAVTGRVALLRGAGNAIVPQVAAAYVRAFLEDSPCRGY